MGDETPEQRVPIYETGVPKPGSLDLTNGNIAENFREWKDLWLLYEKSTGRHKIKDGDMRVATLLLHAGKEARKVYNTTKWEAEADKADPEKVLQKLEEYWFYLLLLVLLSF